LGLFISSPPQLRPFTILIAALTITSRFVTPVFLSTWCMYSIRFLLMRTNQLTHTLFKRRTTVQMMLAPAILLRHWPQSLLLEGARIRSNLVELPKFGVFPLSSRGSPLHDPDRCLYDNLKVRYSRFLVDGGVGGGVGVDSHQLYRKRNRFRSYQTAS